MKLDSSNACRIAAFQMVLSILSKEWLRAGQADSRKGTGLCPAIRSRSCVIRWSSQTRSCLTATGENSPLERMSEDIAIQMAGIRRLRLACRLRRFERIKWQVCHVAIVLHNTWSVCPDVSFLLDCARGALGWSGQLAGTKLMSRSVSLGSQKGRCGSF